MGIYDPAIPQTPCREASIKDCYAMTWKRLSRGCSELFQHLTLAAPADFNSWPLLEKEVTCLLPGKAQMKSHWRHGIIQTLTSTARHRSITITSITIILLMESAAPLRAKRPPPRPVEPVVVGTVRYSAPLAPNLTSVVVATDASSGKELWRERIYRVFIKSVLGGGRSVGFHYVYSSARPQDSRQQ